VAVADILVLKRRHAVLRAIRGVFDDAGFLEVTTPVLQEAPAFEPYIKPFQTAFADAFGSPARPVWLHSSPELDMKRLLAKGAERIFQICPVFRNAETSPLHTPEFTMLEWYERDADLAAGIDRAQAVIGAASRAAGAAMGPAARMTVQEVFNAHFGFDLLETIEPAGALDPDPAPLAEALRPHGITLGEGAGWDDYFHAAMLANIEPALGQSGPTVLTGYPACLGALAKRNDTAPYLVDRFEIYLSGIELANGYAELTDPDDLAERRRVWQSQGAARPAEPTAFLTVMADGLPPSAGVALGFDRLVMLLTGAASVADAQGLPGPVSPPPIRT